MKVDKPFIQAMREATRLVRTEGPAAATRFIQRLLGAVQPAPQTARDDDALVEVLDREENFVPPAAELPRAPLPSRGEFVRRQFANDAGARDYKLYIPSGYAGGEPLLVMLHGCTQNADDFATGTQANRWAESKRWLVVYPEQMPRANSHRCWNWFRRSHQRHGAGEPSIIAGITQQLIDEYRVDPHLVYVAGLSAGGAMAAILGHAYPQLFAAVGVHSGLPVGVARDLPSALALMKNGARGTRAGPSGSAVPLIALHGSADSTVNPLNTEGLVEDALNAYQQSNAVPLQKKVATVDATVGSRAYRRTQHLAADGVSVIEQWEISGAGHAWSGGNDAGSHTDSSGPDATGAMFEFFAQHSLLRSMQAADAEDAATA